MVWEIIRNNGWKGAHKTVALFSVAFIVICFTAPIIGLIVSGLFQVLFEGLLKILGF